MSTAILVRHRARPGQRAAMQAIWEKHVRPRVEANEEHVAYFFCLDSTDPDVVTAFQVYGSATGPARFMSGEWYQSYLSEVAPFIAEPPQISYSDVQWEKPRPNSPGASLPNPGGQPPP